MPPDALPEPIQALRRRAAFPGRGGKVELIQTHLSYVFLVGADVYKIKKPIDLGFANFTTLGKRKQACEDEVRLNRRGCEGGTYVGVETLNQDGDTYRLGGAGKVVDYVVHMKRLPSDGMMDRLLERGAVDFDMIGRVAARLTGLHDEAERGDRITRLGGRAALRRSPWQSRIHPSWSRDIRSSASRSMNSVANRSMRSKRARLSVRPT